MAESRTRGGRSSAAASRSTARSTASDRSSSTALSRADQWRSWTDQMERFFNSWGLGAAGNRIGDWAVWNPQLETFQRGNEFVIRLELPGISKDDVNVEVTDDAVVIHGERREESHDKREGFYRSERTYGSFSRVVPLPDGADTDNVKANFKGGVLEITVPASPREATRGRRLEIGTGT